MPPLDAAHGGVQAAVGVREDDLDALAVRVGGNFGGRDAPLQRLGG